MPTQRFRTLCLSQTLSELQHHVAQFSERPRALERCDYLLLVNTSISRDSGTKDHWRLEARDNEPFGETDAGHIDAVEIPGGFLVITFFDAYPALSQIFWHYIDVFSEVLVAAGVLPRLPPASDTPLGAHRLADNAILLDTAPSRTYHEHPQVEVMCKGDLATLHTFLVQFDLEYRATERWVEEENRRRQRLQRLHRLYRILFDDSSDAAFPAIDRRPNLDAAE